MLRVIRQGVGVLRTLLISRHNHCTAVRHAGGDAHQNRYAQLLRQVKCLTHHVVGFLLVRGFETGDKCKLRIETRVLLVLRGVHRWVVSSHNHQTAVDAGDGRVNEGVGTDIHAHMLHADHRAFAGVGHAESRLHGCLLVGSPAAEDSLGSLGFAELDVLGDFGGRSTRVGVYAAQSGINSALGNGFVT